MATGIVGERLELGSMLNRSFSIFTSSFGEVLKILFYIFLPAQILLNLVPLLMPQVLSMTQPTDFASVNWGMIMPMLLLGIVLVVAVELLLMFTGYIMLILLADKKRQGQETTFGQLFKEAKVIWGRSVSVYILMGLALILGFLLLVIPGIYLSVIWALVLPILVLNPGVRDALGESKKLVQGRWWQTFGYVIVAFIIAALVGWVLALPQTLILQALQLKDAAMVYTIPNTMQLILVILAISLSSLLVLLVTAWDWFFYVIMYRAYEANPVSKE